MATICADSGGDTTTGRRTPLRALVLAGGASRRLGSDKPEERIGGRRLLDIALAAVTHAETVVMVSPPRWVPDGVITVRERPAGSGPVAAIAAGLAALPEGPADVAVLAADLPWITCDMVTALTAARGDASVVCAVDDAGQPQYLTAVWDSTALRVALDAVPSRVQDLLPDDAVTAAVGDVDDVDTRAELASARASLDACDSRLRN